VVSEGESGRDVDESHSVSLPFAHTTGRPAEQYRRGTTSRCARGARAKPDLSAGARAARQRHARPAAHAGQNPVGSEYHLPSCATTTPRHRGAEGGDGPGGSGARDIYSTGVPRTWRERDDYDYHSNNDYEPAESRVRTRTRGHAGTDALAAWFHVVRIPITAHDDADAHVNAHAGPASCACAYSSDYCTPADVHAHAVVEARIVPHPDVPTWFCFFPSSDSKPSAYAQW
jgi:hypothetical protein